MRFLVLFFFTFLYSFFFTFANGFGEPKDTSSKRLKVAYSLSPEALEKCINQIKEKIDQSDVIDKLMCEVPPCTPH